MRLSKFNSFLFVLISLVLVACNGGNNNELLIDESLFQTDSEVSPADDLYSHVNNEWLTSVTIPFGYSEWGAFEELKWRSFVAQRRLLLGVLESENEKFGLEKVKAAQFFKVGMDSLQAETIGFSPLNIFFNRIDSITDNSALLEYLAFQSMYIQCGFINISIEPINSENEEFNVKISPFVLNNYDSLYQKSDSSTAVRKYLNYIGKLSKLADIDIAPSEALDVYNLEKKLMSSYTAVSNHLSNKLSEKSFERLFPNSAWKSFFSKIRTNDTSVLLQSPGYFRFLDENIFGLDTGLNQVKIFLKWSLIRASAEYINYESYKLFTEYNNERVEPRWLRVLEATNRVLGPAVGKLYADNLLGSEFNVKAKEIVDNVLFGYAEYIRTDKLLHDSVKSNLLQKVKDLKLNVGSPDNWIEYKDLIVEYKLSTASFIGNILLANNFNILAGFSKVGSSNSAWRFAPQNAKIEYDINLKQLTIPASLFLEPYTDLSSYAEVNYGSIGVLIAKSLFNNLNGEVVFTNNTGILKQLADSMYFDTLSNRELYLEAAAFDVAYLGLLRAKKMKNIQARDDMVKNFIYSWAKVNRVKSDKTSASKNFLVNTVISTKDLFYESVKVHSNNKLFIADSIRSVLKRN